ncbi:LOW QUALITY PROTEIN: uncharacterized protein LOC108113674 [Drosophila eugracilis]|uniref:LOW QUALITY PROTEIN: uncharacterized protein LOC108113674 n=1 Tax=Drosophila eugracilis TaxID=29029 RepID=UPI001BDB605B|nr:LOW QUALITY PROTEIN: uncharacterized protein LOC108113674 [Drosophila eugracilis]
MGVENIEYNADELQAPAWLNAQFIGGILSVYESVPDLKVTNLEITPASAQGDHYASVMFRTKVEYTSSKGKFTKPLIIKTMPEQDGHKKELLAESHLFETEIGMYCHALPEFERILREAGDDTKLFVPCIYHSLTPRKVLIFEDLVPQGYTVIRNSPPSDGDLKLAYTKLAKWHAVSMKLINEQPNFLKEYKYGFFEMPTVQADPFITTAMGSFIKVLDKIPELRKYKPHFEKIKDNYMERLQVEMHEYHKYRRNDRYYVLCHGDFHLRNMMFRHNKKLGANDDVMLVDFQFCNLVPITIDLTYSIYMLMEPQHRREMGISLINDYFSVLLETLKKIGYKGEMPTQNGLWSQIQHNKYYDFFMITTLLPLMLGVKNNTLKMHEALQNPEARLKSYFFDSYVKEVSELLPKYEKLGYFNDL